MSITTTETETFLQWQLRQVPSAATCQHCHDNGLPVEECGQLHFVIEEEFAETYFNEDIWDEEWRDEVTYAQKLRWFKKVYRTIGIPGAELAFEKPGHVFLSFIGI